jgi:hypothetical protein
MTGLLLFVIANSIIYAVFVMNGAGRTIFPLFTALALWGMCVNCLATDRRFLAGVSGIAFLLFTAVWLFFLLH